MSEMAVLVIRIRKEQAGEYERLFEQEELPRWRDYHQRGLFKSARIFRSAFGSSESDDIANYVIAVESEGEGHHEHDNDPGFRSFNERADAFQPEDPLVFGGEPLFSVG
ncbi:MAG: hypothetical protein E6I36_05795 [Chloroflexi bacterium]|nr:MAG: hypothetical protein E6I36_05795 [Chloroflexota bacterium]